MSTGNVAFAPLRLMLLLGQFNYGARGILDLTHTRLLTFATFRRLLEGASFRLEEERGVVAPFTTGPRRPAARQNPARRQPRLLRLRPELFCVPDLRRRDGHSRRSHTCSASQSSARERCAVHPDDDEDGRRRPATRGCAVTPARDPRRQSHRQTPARGTRTSPTRRSPAARRGTRLTRTPATTTIAARISANVEASAVTVTSQ